MRVGAALFRAESRRPRDLRVVYANASCKDHLGFDLRERIGLTINEIAPAAAKFWGAAMLKVVTTGEPAIIEGEGTVTPGYFRAEFLPIGDDHVLSTFENVTGARMAEFSRKRDQERMAAVNAALDRFATAVAHDLKAPLSAIHGFASVLATASGLSPEDRELTTRLMATSRRAAAMVDDLLDFARHAGAGGERRAVDMEAVLDWALEMLAGTIRASGASISRQPVPPVWGNDSALRQVVLNILGNSLKYTKPGLWPTIRIGAEAADADGLVTIWVADDGRGIPPEYRAAAFDLGVRLGVESTNGSEPVESSGSGIGLATCAAVVAHHGGRIWIDETPGSGGTTVYLALPNAELPQVVEQPDPGRAVTVFVIDDDPDSRSLVRLVLREGGGSVVGAAPEGSTALARLAELERRPDVIVLDHRLPGDDGLSVAGRIRRRWPKQPIVLLTSHLDNRLRVAAQAAGIDATLPKQEIGSLKAVVDRLCWEGSQATG